jgi:hypothetical protein
MGSAASQREDEQNLLMVARRILEVDKLRRRFFPSAIFGEPAWNILLKLFVASSRADRTISSLGESSGVPLSTAIRWLDYLEAEGLVMLDRSPHDPQQKEVHLTDKAYNALRSFLGESISSRQLIC